MMRNLFRHSWPLLFLVIVIVPAKSSEKVGRCPREILDKNSCKDQVDQCKKNEDCNGESLCCSTGCNNACVLPSFTACDHLSYFFKTQAKLLKPEEAVGVLVPKCTKSGAFEEIQCNENTGLCWCVDDSGFEKAGTRENSREAVNCTRSSDRCSGPQCRMLCPYGFELDKHGCEMCLCKNICTGIKCPGSLECQLQEVSCATEPCPPVPTCKKPRTLESLCPIGTPFTIPESGNPFLCGTSPGKPTCPPGFNCNVHSGDDYGVCCGSELFFEKPGLCAQFSLSTANSDEPLSESQCQHDLDCPEMKKCCMTDSRGKQCRDALNSTLCLQQKKIAEILSTKEIEGRGYIPQCDSDGNFLTTQCSRNGKICWCVDEAGRNIPRSLAPSGVINCTNIIIPQRRDLVHGNGESRITDGGGCDLNLCANTCEYGYKTDEVTGCGTCDCILDPCQSLQCPPGTKCSFAVSSECQGSGCQIQPICKPNVLHVNPCDNGQPLFDHFTNRLLVCSENGGATCPSSHICVKASVNTDGLCCLNVPRLESTKPGMCPFISSSLCNGTDSERNQCNADSECEGDMKCCALACGAICADPSFDAQTESNKLPTMCQYLEGIEMKANEVLKNFKLAINIPKCRSSGEFGEIQCSGDWCFCVDEFGMEIPSTKISQIQNNLTSEFCLEKRQFPSCLDMTCRIGCDYGYKTKDNCRICECVNPCEQNNLCDEDHYCEMVDMDCPEGYCPAVPYCIPRIYAAIAKSQQQFPSEGICPTGFPYFDNEMNVSLTCRPRARMLQCPDDYFCHELDSNHDFGQCCPIIERSDESANRERESSISVTSRGNNFEDFSSNSKTRLSDCELARERQMELVLDNTRINYIPRCDKATGAWKPIQCIDEVNLCWCVNPAGSRVSGSSTRGKPICNFRQSRGKFLGDESKFDQGVCANGQTVHVCNKSLCEGRICMAYPEATCGIDPCGGCRVRFYDENNKVVDCDTGLGKCQKDAQGIMNSRAWINQQKQSGRFRDEDENFTSALEDIIDDVLQERLGRTIVSPGTTTFPTVGDLVTEVMKQSRNSFGSFGDKVSGFLVRNSPTDSRSSRKVSALSGKLSPESSEFPEIFSDDNLAATNTLLKPVPMMIRKGSCPQPSPTEILFRLSGTCMDLCNYDDECSQDERCCLIDCGYRCKKVVVELQVKVVQEQDDQEGSSSLESLVADFQESNMLLNPPICRANGEYERRQSQGELMWCVDAEGRPHPESLTRGHLVCSEKGQMVQKSSTHRICPDPEIFPMICGDQCLKASCKSHPDAICVADPCNSCQISFFIPSGEKVLCEDKCQQKLEQSPCRASFTRYFYNSSSNRCEEFLWGGCQGNDNNFETIDDCQSNCGHRQVDICTLRLETQEGCDEKTGRWYFDSETETCQKFHGCPQDGTNNFATLQHCEFRCPRHVLCPNLVEGGLNICDRVEACKNLTQSCASYDQYICNVDPCSCTAEFKYLDGKTAKCEILPTELDTSDSTETAQTARAADLVLNDDPIHDSSEINEDSLSPLPTFQNENISENISTTVAHFTPTENNGNLLVVRPGLQEIKPRCFSMKEKYFSKCDNNGNFVPTQCSAEEPVCWCVDSIGNQLEHTSTFLAGSTTCPTVIVQEVNVRLSFPAKSDSISPSQLGIEVQDLLRNLGAKLVEDKVSVDEGVEGLVNVDFTLEGESSGQISHVLEEGLRNNLFGIYVQNQLTLADLSSSRFHYVVGRETVREETVVPTVVQETVEPETVGSETVAGSGDDRTTSPTDDSESSERDAPNDTEVVVPFVNDISEATSDIGAIKRSDGVTAREVSQRNEELNAVAIILTVIAAITAVLIIVGLLLAFQNKKSVPNYPKNKFRPIAFSSPFGTIDKKQIEGADKI